MSHAVSRRSNFCVSPCPVWRRSVIGLALVVGFAPIVRTQIAMPDAKQMSGIPRPVDDLPAGTVSVRLVRGDLSNNIVNHPVELQVDGKVTVVATDEGGRAQFSGLTPGAPLKAVAVVDGERLESQEFPAPAGGGIRMLLVATDKEKEARAAEAAKAPAVTGPVIIGGESRIVIEPDGEERARVYYLLDISNTAQVPVNPPTPFRFDVPTSALGTSIMEGSSPQASVNGRRVQVQGPFAPGNTLVQAAFALPVSSSGAIEISQPFPAPLAHLAVIVKKVGNARLVLTADRQTAGDAGQRQLYIAAAGSGGVAAGEPVVLSVTDLPHHSLVPRSIALSIALGIVVVGVWAARRHDPEERGAARKALIARREKLFQDLVRLELDRRRGRGDQSRHAARREELVAALEHVYGCARLRRHDSRARWRRRRRRAEFRLRPGGPGRRLASFRAASRRHAGDAHRAPRRHPGFAGPQRRGQVDADRHAGHARHPDERPILYGERPSLRAGPDIRRCIGLLAHELHLYPELSARQNLDFFARLYGLDPRAVVPAALDAAGLGDRADDEVSAFSRGMRQRLALERALLHRPRLVLLDEPFTGLDDQAVATVSDRLRRLAAEGAIVVLATHDLDLADGLVTRVAVSTAAASSPTRPAPVSARAIARWSAARENHRNAVSGAGSPALRAPFDVRRSAFGVPENEEHRPDHKQMFLRTALLVLKKDFAIEVRSREILYTTLLFAVSCVMIFSIAFVKEGEPVPGAAPGILWVAIAFAGTLALGRTFERERYGETLRALLLAPAPRPAIYVGKLLGMVVLMARPSCCWCR